MHLANKLKNTWFTRSLSRNLAIALTVAATISSIATYSAITHSSTPFGPDPNTVLKLVLANLALLLALASIISYKIYGLWLARRQGSVGSRLQTRIILMFSVVAIIPTIIVAVFSALFFNYGIKAWFDDRVGTALEESVAVAESYLGEHKKIISADALAMAHDLSRQAPVLRTNAKRFKQVVATQAALRSLTEAIVFQRSNVIAEGPLSFSLRYDVENIAPEELQRAANGEVVIITNDTEDKVRALIKLNGFLDTYMFVGRFIDSKILSHVESTKGSASEYRKLKTNISTLQIKFSTVFVGVALLLLLAAIWFGMIFASDLVTPISTLVSATERVKAGDLETRVGEGPQNDEIGTLTRAFNRMTDQLEKQRSQLIEVNRQIDTRRRFIEAVLSGVSAGVIALDSEKKISLVNRSAARLLSIDPEEVRQKDLVDLYPDIAPLLDEAERKPEKNVDGEITITHDSKKSSFHIRIVAEEFSDEIEGYIVTLDDITELQSAQRRAAWADVARRIAHEIKNPLTPIHLSAERLRRKYKKEVESDPELFEKYTSTIIRHVEDIGTMVEEFVNFARMPAPVFEEHDLCSLINDAIFSRQSTNPDINYIHELPAEPVIINCDRSQVTQALTNIIKNAGEVLEENKIKKAAIRIVLEQNDEVTVTIEDNGPGFPEELLDQITEPYVTTREKGTGLGLAIVKKIMDDHDGSLQVENLISPKGKIDGARVTLTFPKVG